MDNYLATVQKNIIDEINKTGTEIVTPEALTLLLHARYEHEKLYASMDYVGVLKQYFERLSVYMLNETGVAPMPKASIITLIQNFSI